MNKKSSLTSGPFGNTDPSLLEKINKIPNQDPELDDCAIELWNIY